VEVSILFFLVVVAVLGLLVLWDVIVYYIGDKMCKLNHLRIIYFANMSLCFLRTATIKLGACFERDVTAVKVSQIFGLRSPRANLLDFLKVEHFHVTIHLLHIYKYIHTVAPLMNSTHIISSPLSKSLASAKYGPHDYIH
jgi:hypothetical protein